MKKLKNFSRNLLKNQSGQGATEYILLLVVVVSLVLLFKKDIQTAVSGKIDDLKNGMSNINVQN
ncbi:MAG TPA: Flp1 family type IVb pilin [Bdellovibrio sp.]|nr:Flp1 family type IVb pilin [Bdellovibrio sp.]